jgi:hypothetical protein
VSNPESIKDHALYATAVAKGLPAINNLHAQFKAVWMMDEKASEAMAKEILAYEVESQAMAEAKARELDTTVTTAVAKAKAAKPTPKPVAPPRERNEPKTKAYKNTQIGFETVCVVCQCKFIKTQVIHRYCGPDCSKITARIRQKASRQERNALNPRPVKVLEEKSCLVCGEVFTKGCLKNTLCSNRCYKRFKTAWRGVLHDIPCPSCDTVFTPINKLQEFCSKKCVSRAYRKKHRELKETNMKDSQTL